MEVTIYIPKDEGEGFKELGVYEMPQAPAVGDMVEVDGALGFVHLRTFFKTDEWRVSINLTYGSTPH